MSRYNVVFVVPLKVTLYSKFDCNLLVKLYICQPLEKLLTHVCKPTQPLVNVEIFNLPSGVSQIFTEIVRIYNDWCAHKISKVWLITW